MEVSTLAHVVFNLLRFPPTLDLVLLTPKHSFGWEQDLIHPSSFFFPLIFSPRCGQQSASCERWHIRGLIIISPEVSTGPGTGGHWNQLELHNYNRAMKNKIVILCNGDWSARNCRREGSYWCSLWSYVNIALLMDEIFLNSRKEGIRMLPSDWGYVYIQDTVVRLPLMLGNSVLWSSSLAWGDN